MLDHIDFKSLYSNKIMATIHFNVLTHKVSVVNYTDIIPLRPFGVVENPTWEDFEIFLESRCFERGRNDVKRQLELLGLDCYDPFSICLRTHGRVTEDSFELLFYDSEQGR